MECASSTHACKYHPHLQRSQCKRKRGIVLPSSTHHAITYVVSISLPLDPPTHRLPLQPFNSPHTQNMTSRNIDDTIASTERIGVEGVQQFSVQMRVRVENFKLSLTNFWLNLFGSLGGHSFVYTTCNSLFILVHHHHHSTNQPTDRTVRPIVHSLLLNIVTFIYRFLLLVFFFFCSAVC